LEYRTDRLERRAFFSKYRSGHAARYNQTASEAIPDHGGQSRGAHIMTPIAEYPLWIGHGGEAHDYPAILDAGIEAVVDLAAEEPSRAPPRALIVCRFPLIDGYGNRPELLTLAVRSISSLIASCTPTLVCCGAGLSRAPALVASALSLVYRGSPETFLKQVTRHHHSDVSPGLWDDLMQLSAHGFPVGRSEDFAGR
jgi:protein-tyrosine phosphatase